MGLGLRGIEQMTAEAEAVLHSCRTVLVAHADPSVVPDLVVRGHTVHDLAEYWHGHRTWTDTHSAIAERVLAEAEHGSPVALAVYGHPSSWSARRPSSWHEHGSAAGAPGSCPASRRWRACWRSWRSTPATRD